MDPFCWQIYWVLLSVLSVPAFVFSHGDGDHDHPTMYTIDGVSVNKTELDKYLDRCMLGVSHKDKPSKEAYLYEQCQPWKDRACCDSDTTERLHRNPTWYNFDWNHCKQKMSDECKLWMRQDLCFYECSPNVGPWLVEHKITIRDERFMGVPLCKSECDKWFDACKNDFTCKDDWSKGWNWTMGSNQCPEGTVCETIQTKFKTADNFCENIWGGSFEVVDDSESCMALWFNNANPNDEVARKKALELLGVNGQPPQGQHPVLYLTLSLLLILTSYLFS